MPLMEELKQDLKQGANRLFQLPLICTKRRRFPARASTNQGLEKGDLVLMEELKQDLETRKSSFQIALYLYHTPPDTIARQFKSRK